MLVLVQVTAAKSVPAGSYFCRKNYHLKMESTMESKFNNIFKFNGKQTIYNSLSKASIELENNTIQDYINNCDEVNLNILKSNGFVVDNDFNENLALEYLFKKNFFNNKRFLNIVLVPSLACNFKCPYCFEKVNTNKNYFNSQVDEYFEQLKIYSKNNFNNYENIEISLFGGEPLLFFDRIINYFEQIEEYFPNLNYTSSIVTNGALLTKVRILQLLKYNCKSFQITIDGYKDTHDKLRIFKDGRPSYDLLIKNINEFVPLLPEDCIFNLRINLNNVSVENVKRTLNDVDSNIRHKIKVLFRPVYNTDCFNQKNTNNLSELKQYYDLAIKYGYEIVKNTYFYQSCESCSGDNFFFIMPDMTVWKCINDLNFKKACIGKIESNGEIKFNAKNLINWYNLSNCFNDIECKNCSLLPDCFGGCVLYKAKNNKKSCKTFDMASMPYLY